MTTTLNKEYALRFLGVAVLFLALSGWFLYDGFIGYPRKNAEVKPVATALALQEKTPEDWMNTAKTGTAPLVEAFREKGLDVPAKYTDAFNSLLNTNHPDAKNPKVAQAILLQPVYTENDILAQFISAGIGLAATALLLVIVCVRKVTRYTLEGETLTVSFMGKSTDYPLNTLRTIDLSQWKSRGILRVQFEQGIVKLDAWHHAGVRAIADRLFEVAGVEAEQKDA